MLLVKTSLRMSTIPEAGIGCFAAEKIPQGYKIWQFNPYIDRVFTQDEFDSFDSLQQEFLKIYCYMHDARYYLCVDNSRFFNHSSDPNTYESITQQATYAARDIESGEEILSNYSDFGVTDQDRIFNIQL